MTPVNDIVCEIAKYDMTSYEGQCTSAPNILRTSRRGQVFAAKDALHKEEMEANKSALSRASADAAVAFDGAQATLAFFQ